MPDDQVKSSFKMGDVSQISLYTLPRSFQHPRNTLIFFITGNPGLIEFYTNYLNTLHSLLLPGSNASQNQIHIYGQSMAGFSDDQTSLKGVPYSLEDQIQILESSLNNLCTSSETQDAPAYDNVVLIGHSVGSYILLELIRRVRKSPSTIAIDAGILLFPTVTHIAQSPSGIKISRLFQWRDSPRRVGRTLQRIFSLLPRVVVSWLVRTVTGMSRDFTAVVTKFLVSKIGIWQALHMARDEMKYINEDKWDEEIWGVESEDVKQQNPPPRLIFYFGQDDHWVANHTRDALVDARGRKQGQSADRGPVMIICQDGIPHGFCLNHSELMAEKTKVWIEDMLWDL